MLESSGSCSAFNPTSTKTDTGTKDYNIHIPHGNSCFGTEKRTLGITSRMLEHQVFLLEQDNVKLTVTNALNPDKFSKLQKKPRDLP